MEFVYVGEFTLKDGTVEQRNLEDKWADKDFLEKIAVFTLVPRVAGWPLLRVHIPDKAKPVWVWRVYREASPLVPVEEGGEMPTIREMRIYGVGFKKRGQKPHLTWVIPGGHIETGTSDSTLANTLWRGQ